MWRSVYIGKVPCGVGSVSCLKNFRIVTIEGCVFAFFLDKGFSQDRLVEMESPSRSKIQSKHRVIVFFSEIKPQKRNKVFNYPYERRRNESF